VQEVTEITTSLKALAKEPQYSGGRAVAAVGGRSKAATTSIRNCPTCAKSGSIEQDADVVAVRLPRRILPAKQGTQARHGANHEKWQGWDMELALGKAEVIIAKPAPRGPTGTVQLQFEGQFTPIYAISSRGIIFPTGWP